MPQTVSRSQPNGKNKQAQASAVLFSICNKPPERQATASCLAHREWNRLYTWENTAHWVAFFNRIPGTLLKSPVRSHLQVLWAGLCLRDRKGRRGVRLRGDLEKWMQAFLVRRGERAFWYTCQTHEQSTSVHPLLLRQMSQSKNRAFWKHSTLISASLCHTVSLFFHTNMSAHTHTYTDKEEEMQMGLEQKCHNANTACKIQHQHYAKQHQCFGVASRTATDIKNLLDQTCGATCCGDTLWISEQPKVNFILKCN